MNAYLVLGAMVVAAGYTVGTFYLGVDYGEQRQLARANSTQEIADAAALKVSADLSGLLAQLKPVNKTIVQKVQHEVQTRVEYRDCRHDDGMLNTLNRALAGPASSQKDPAGAGLPAADPAGRRLLWGDHGEADRGGRRLPRVSMRGAGAAVPPAP